MAGSIGVRRNSRPGWAPRPPAHASRARRAIAHVTASVVRARRSITRAGDLSGLTSQAARAELAQEFAAQGTPQPTCLGRVHRPIRFDTIYDFRGGAGHVATAAPGDRDYNGGR